MEQKPRRIATITINIENRNDGLYISSNDMPGLWLWGRDPQQVLQSIIPTIKELYKYNERLSVDVREVEQSKSFRPFGQERISDKFEIYEGKESQHGNLSG